MLCCSVKDLVCTKTSDNDQSTCKFVFSEGDRLPLHPCSVKDLTCTGAQSNDKSTCNFVMSEGLRSGRADFIHGSLVEQG